MLTRSPMTYMLRWICPLQFLWDKSPARLANEGDSCSAHKKLAGSAEIVPAPACFLAQGLADAILAAINDNCLPGNKCSIIACQKQNRT